MARTSIIEVTEIVTQELAMRRKELSNRIELILGHLVPAARADLGGEVLFSM